MPKVGDNSEATLPELLKQILQLRESLAAFKHSQATGKPKGTVIKRFVAESGSLVDDLQQIRQKVSSVRFGTIGITLGRSDSIAKFFAFSFNNQEKRCLDKLADAPFYGAGIYAIYYHGRVEKAYLPLAGTETPIYVGKADPKNPQAETAEEQGQALYLRLREHARNIGRTELPLADFRYRAAPIQTGMQAAVEDFMIRLFRPVWNKEIKICYGIGKHGDKATTRANKRSPWDTMHPGRKWAADTMADQMNRTEIEKKIAEHFKEHPVVADKDTLFKLLSLE
jgi:hypothetical protein